MATSWEWCYANPKMKNIHADNGFALAANFIQPNKNDEKFTLVVRIIDENFPIKKVVDYFKSFGSISGVKKRPVS